MRALDTKTILIGALSLALVGGLQAGAGAGSTGEIRWELTLLGNAHKNTFQEITTSTGLMNEMRARFGNATPALEDARIRRRQNGQTYEMSDGGVYQLERTIRVEGHDVAIFRDFSGRVALATHTRPREWLLAQHRAYSIALEKGLSEGSAKLVQAFAARIYKEDVNARDKAAEYFSDKLKAAGLDQMDVNPREDQTDEEFYQSLRDRERLRRFQANLDEISETSDGWTRWTEGEDLAEQAMKQVTPKGEITDEELEELYRNWKNDEEPTPFDDISYEPTPGYGGLLGL